VSRLAFALVLVAACGGPRDAKTVSMRLTGSPPTATVTVDDHYVGTLDVVSARGMALPPGSHRISVEAPGYFPWDKVVEAKEAEGPLRLAVNLVRVPD
jgi:hypothetical protein